MSKVEKKCKVCGRIITDSDNKTGLCPKHQDGANTIGFIALGGVVIAGSHFGGKAIKSVVNVITTVKK